MPAAAKVEQYRAEYLRLLRLWRTRFTTGVFRSLRQEPVPERIARSLAEGATSLTIGGVGELHSSELYRTRTAARPYLVFVPESVRQSVRRTKRGNRCFLGCRFKEPHKSLLESNLKKLFECYGLQLSADDADVSLRSLMPGIVQKIRDASICVFDTRHTSRKPNVFIETGAAFALEKPTILLARAGSAGGTAGDWPSDLAGMVYVDYSSYQGLIDRLSIRLPEKLVGWLA